MAGPFLLRYDVDARQRCWASSRRTFHENPGYARLPRRVTFRVRC